MIPMGMAVRFIHFALFDETLLAPLNVFVIETTILIVIVSCLSFERTRALQMVQAIFTLGSYQPLRPAGVAAAARCASVRSIEAKKMPMTDRRQISRQASGLARPGTPFRPPGSIDNSGISVRNTPYEKRVNIIGLALGASLALSTAAFAQDITSPSPGR